MGVKYVAPEGQPAVGTVYMTPDGYILRVRNYDQRSDDLFSDKYVDSADAFANAPWHPQWSCQTPSGGATGYYGDLPEGSTVIWDPTTQGHCKNCSQPLTLDDDGVWVDGLRDPRYCTSAIDFRHEPVKVIG